MGFRSLHSLILEPRFVGFFCLLLIIITLYMFNNDNEEMRQQHREKREESAYKAHLEIVNKYLKKRENWTTSVLGSWIFKQNVHVVPRKRIFIVHVYYSQDLEDDYFDGCSVTNCIFTKNENRLSLVDAVVVNMFRGYIPVVKHRPPQQRWIFFYDESPINAFAKAKRKVNLTDLANIFNWSLSYRSDADIPIPYGRTVPLDQPIFMNNDKNAISNIIPYWDSKKRDVLVTILTSNCLLFRLKFIARLQKVIPVDVYGECSFNASVIELCPGYFKEDCDIMTPYLFYLALENSDCREYMTEKIWYNSYLRGAIPIIMGPPLSDCKLILPPNSFLYIPVRYNRTDVQNLAKQIIQISKNEDLLLSYHQWRNHFEAVNEHEFFKSKSVKLCRVCEALNYNDPAPKVYSEKDIRAFLDPKLLCGK